MAAIKLFGATITVKCPVKVEHDHDRDRDRATSKTTTSSSSLSSSSLSDQGAVGDRTKKPDKIIPCPRCKSMETKFCYFNNYNFNQPRHFCKGCHRYWTAGGALRNVPVGAGRRKSRPPPSTTLPPCRAAGDGIYDDCGDHCQFMEQGSLQLQLQHVVGIKRRRIGFDYDYDYDYDPCC